MNEGTEKRELEEKKIRKIANGIMEYFELNNIIPIDGVEAMHSIIVHFCKQAKIPPETFEKYLNVLIEEYKK